jgi:hypothetical protein
MITGVRARIIDRPTLALRLILRHPTMTDMASSSRPLALVPRVASRVAAFVDMPRVRQHYGALQGRPGPALSNDN